MSDHPQPIEDAGFLRRMQEIETLVHDLEQAPDPRLRGRAQELVRALMDLHKAGLARVLEVIRRHDGAPIVNELASDELVANVLQLHDLHPVPLDVRVQQAIGSARTRAVRHGGEVELIENGDGKARVRIAAGSGCGSSTDSIREIVEAALYAEAPDLRELEFDTVAPPPAQAFVPLQQLKSSRPSTTEAAVSVAGAAPLR